MNLVLWTLNRVAEWDIEALAAALRGGGRHAVRLGSRQRCDQDTALSKPGVLSHERDGFNEYFVPIPVKCLGEPESFLADFRGQMKDDGPAFVDQLCRAYPEHFEPRNAPRYRVYWTSGDGLPRSGIAMFTRPWLGFYQLISRDLRPGEQAVLVGYSQGGLVARFLAFLDERLMRPAERKVAGVITVQSPNAGSPLANSRNADQAALGLFGVLSGVAGFPIPPCGTSETLGQTENQLAVGSLQTSDGKRHFDIAAFCCLTEAALADSKAKLAKLQKPSAGERKAALDKVNLLATARRWLSGLEPLPGCVTAFADINAATLDLPGTVLNLLMTHPFQATYHGAVIGTDNQLSDLVVSGRPWYQRLVLRLVQQVAGLATPIGEAEMAYAKIAMDEREILGKIASPKAQAVAKRYWEGDPDHSIPPRAHDFVIPSVSQLIPEGARPFFLGNEINPKGTHISGAKEHEPDSDRPFVVRMLAEMGKRLAPRS